MGCDKKPVLESNIELGPTQPPETEKFYVNSKKGISGQKNGRFSGDNQTIEDHFKSVGDRSDSAEISNSSDVLPPVFDRQKIGLNPGLVSDHVVRLQTQSSGQGSFEGIRQRLTDSLPTRAGLVSKRIRNIRKLIEGRDLSLSPSAKRKFDQNEDPQDQKKQRL